LELKEKEQPQYSEQEKLEHKQDLVEFLTMQMKNSTVASDIKKRELEKMKRYLFTIPPDFEEAKRHGNAQKLRISLEGAKERKNRCICCDRLKPEFTRKVGYCEDPRVMIEHGDGFPLLFQFIKYVAALFAGMLIFQGIFFFIVNMYHFFSESVNFTLANFISANNIIGDKELGTDIIYVYEVSALLTNIVMIAMTIIFWFRQQAFVDGLDSEAKTDSDYGVMITNLPYTTLSSELRNILIERVGLMDEDIVYINKCYEYDYILNLKKEQIKWLQLKKDLEVYREKKKENNEPYEDAYPPSLTFSFNPCKKYPREHEIIAKLEEVNNELLQENNKLVQY